MNIVYLNGKFIPIEQAKVSVLDRGFLFGDGVYEVIPVYAGQPFRLPQHLQRLQYSLKEIRLAEPIDSQALKIIIDKLIIENGDGDLAIYLQITRGIAPQRLHTFPAEIQATIFISATRLPRPEIAKLAKGFAAITSEDIRWRRCDIKTISLLPNILMRQQAADVAAIETILIADGNAIEGATSNLFIVKDHTIITPPKGAHILGGITRDYVIELAKNQHLPLRQATISQQELRHADEIWITSSSKEIAPIVKLDNEPVSTGQVGPIWKKMIALYQQALS